MNTQLTPEQHYILREKGTEPPFTGKYWDTKEKGIYYCVECGNPLFSSQHKFDSGTGWPSFDRTISTTTVQEQEVPNDTMHRMEVVCAQCKGHLGHVFDDGPKQTTGKRYCINSTALKFQQEIKQKK